MIPDVEFLKSAPLIHKFGDLFNPPALAGSLGVVQTGIDLTSICSINFPPFATADHHTARLFVNHRYFQATGRPITFTWYPDRVVRQASYEDLQLESVTTLPVGKRAVVIELNISNRSAREKNVHIRLGLKGTITQAQSHWVRPLPPCETDNRADTDSGTKSVIFTARSSRAVMVQGSYPAPDRIAEGGLEYEFALDPGQTHSIWFIASLAATKADALSLFNELRTNPRREMEKSRNYWNDELRAMFTPGNDRFSGSLPELNTTEEDILRLYVLGALGVVYFKRDVPESVYGRAYDTLLPRYWQTVTFIWDYALSSFVHALLDPVVMKKYMEKWMQLDVHKHFGTEYLTGGPVGNWYSANDFNMIVLMHDYLRWTGDRKWLNKEVSDPHAKTNRRVIDYARYYALGWKRFQSASGLADYGEIDNLLECVSTYIHEVASLNAANVFNMRTVANIFDFIGNKEQAGILRDQSDELLRQVQKLYAPGKGHWMTRFPDGHLVDVRHCYDFFTILDTIGHELSREQQNEMVDFFRRELQTPAWMRALAPSDHNAMFSVRPDHQWNGAYPAWPAQSLKALYKIGRADLAYPWMKGLARSFNQGPPGQAHFVDDVIDPEDGGARKASSEVPYITDWACSASGSWVSVIVESLFGVRAYLDGTIGASPQFDGFDAGAELINLVHRGKKYRVTRNGLHNQE